MFVSPGSTQQERGLAGAICERANCNCTQQSNTLPADLCHMDSAWTDFCGRLRLPARLGLLDDAVRAVVKIEISLPDEFDDLIECCVEVHFVVLVVDLIRADRRLEAVRVEQE